MPEHLKLSITVCLDILRNSKIKQALVYWLSLMCLMGGPALAVTDAQLDKLWGNNFKGWEGIYFACNHKTGSQLSSICNSAQTNFKFLASSLNIKYLIGEPNDHFGLGIEMRMKRHLILSLSLQQAGNAVSGQLRFEMDGDQIISEHTRTGDLIFWETPVIAVGGESLATTVSNVFEDTMKEMLVAFKRNNDQK